jgi:regulatory protein
MSSPRSPKVEPTCYGKAIDLLSRRGHFRRELETKLSRRGFDEEEVAATLERLYREGLVDDVQTTRQWIEERLRRGDVGRLRLASELDRRGVDHEVSRSLLTELLPEDDRDAARGAAEGWLRRQPPRRQGQALEAALARHLQRRGFSRRAIFGVLRQVREAAAAEGSEAPSYDSDF